MSYLVFSSEGNFCSWNSATLHIWPSKKCRTCLKKRVFFCCFSALDPAQVVQGRSRVLVVHEFRAISETISRIPDVPLLVEQKLDKRKEKSNKTHGDLHLVQ